MRGNLKKKDFHTKSQGKGNKKDLSDDTGKKNIKAARAKNIVGAANARKKNKSKTTYNTFANFERHQNSNDIFSSNYEQFSESGYRLESSKDVQGEVADYVSDYEIKGINEINQTGTSLKGALKRNTTDIIENGIRKRKKSNYTIRKRNTEYVAKTKSSVARNGIKKGGTALKTRKVEADVVKKPIEKSAQKSAKKIAQKNAKITRKTAQKTAKKTAEAIKKTVKEVIRVIKEIIREVLKELIELLMATGAGEVILIIIIVILLIIAVILLIVSIGSVFNLTLGLGLLTEDNNPALTEVVNSLNEEMEAQIEEIKEAHTGEYDVYELTNGSSIVSNWTDVLVVFMEKAINADMDVSLFDDEQEQMLRETYWEMNSVSSRIVVEEGQRMFYVSISSMDYLTYAHVMGMTDEDIENMQLLIESAGGNMKSLVGSYVDISISDEDMNILNGLEGLPEERQAVVQAAYSLIGKVGYFWGGKSYVSGWDSRWGTSMLVTAGGDETSGTYQPYGLDCSGFVGWTFAQAFNGYRCTQGAANQYRNWCTSISWSTAIPGDLVFFNDLSHVGIVAAKNSDGTLTIIHCSTSGGVKVGNYRQQQNAFYLVGRPSNFR